MKITKLELANIISEEIDNSINESPQARRARARRKRRRQLELLNNPARGKYGLGGAGVTVKDIQVALFSIDKDKYYPISAGVRPGSPITTKKYLKATDGVYGGKTFRAIKQFQRDFPPDDGGDDGLVGAFTAAKIIEKAPDSSFAKKLAKTGVAMKLTKGGMSTIAKGQRAAARSGPTPVDTSVAQVSPENAPEKPVQKVQAMSGGKAVKTAPGMDLDKKQILQTAASGVAKGTYKKLAIESPGDVESIIDSLAKSLVDSREELEGVLGVKGEDSVRDELKKRREQATTAIVNKTPGWEAQRDILQWFSATQTSRDKAMSLMMQVEKEKATAIKEKLPDRPPSWVIDIIKKNEQDEDAVKQIRARYDYIKKAYPKYTSYMFKAAGAYGGTDAASATQKQAAKRKSAKAARAKSYLDQKAAERAARQRPVSESVKSLKIKIIESKAEEKIGLKTPLPAYQLPKDKPPAIGKESMTTMTWAEA